MSYTEKKKKHEDRVTPTCTDIQDTEDANKNTQEVERVVMHFQKKDIL